MTRSMLEIHLTEVLMRELARCDLGDGIEVIHDVEAVEVEMDCDLEDDDPTDVDHTTRWFDEQFAGTIKFAREPLADAIGTHRFVRESAPYERIEIELDPNAFIRATIEEACRVTV